MRKPIMILLIIFSVVVVTVVGYMANTYEIKTETTETRLESWDVLKNKYLAAEYYLKNTGRTVETLQATKFFRILSKDLPQQTTVILLNKIDYLDYDQEYALLDWIEQGGTVVIEAEVGSDFLDDLGVIVSANIGQVGVSSLYDDAGKIAQLNFDGHISMTVDGENLTVQRQSFIEEEGGLTYAELSYGQGKIHLLSRLRIWDNHHIDQEDHAWLLDAIATDDVVIVKLKNNEGGGLNKVLQALVDNFLYTMIILMLLIVLILWNQGMRSGEIQESSSRDRRTLSEYLKALANFYKQENGYASLITTLQYDIESRMTLRYHAYQLLSQDEKNRQLSQLADVPIETVAILMSHNITSQKISTLQFIRRVAELQKIRNRL